MPHISDNIQYFSFSVWLISLSIITSRSIHVVANGKISFSFLIGWVIFHYVCTIFIHLYVDGYLVCFYVLAVVKMLLWTLGCMYLFELVFSFSSDICPGVKLLDHMVVLFLVFWGTSILFSIVATPIYIPTNSVLGFSFLHILVSIYYL